MKDIGRCWLLLWTYDKRSLPKEVNEGNWWRRTFTLVLHQVFAASGWLGMYTIQVFHFCCSRQDQKER